MNYLDSTIKRTVHVCNYNEHINSAHPDRIMEDHDLIYIREGCWSICQDEITYDLAPGDMILLQAGHHHFGPAPCVGTVKTIFVHFSRSERDLTEKNDKAAGLCEDSFYRFPSVVHCGTACAAVSGLYQLLQTYWSRDPKIQRKASAYLDLLLCELANAGDVVRQSSPAVDRALELIRSTPNHFFTADELSGILHFSSRSISGKFKAATGETLHAYQMNLKCRMADELMMSNPSLTLREISQTFGFCDEYHFSKCYKKKYGRPPKSGRQP